MIEKKCKYCDKKIEGHTENQVNHMMNQHVISKHPSEVKFK